MDDGSNFASCCLIGLACSSDGSRLATFWNGAASTYNDANITVHDVEGHNISGQIVSTDSLSSGPITVEYGRAVNALTWSTANSYYSGKPFQPNSHVTYQNVQ